MSHHLCQISYVNFVVVPFSSTFIVKCNRVWLKLSSLCLCLLLAHIRLPRTEVPSGSQRGTAPISIKRRSGSRCWLSFNETKGDVARNEVDHADDDQGGANRITGQNRSRSRDNCDSSSNISGSGQGGHQMEQRGCSGSGGNSESGEGGNPKGSEDDSENCAPSSGLEESWYVAPSACIARR